MKFKLIITTFIMSLFLVASAFAVPYHVNFDPDGSGTNFGPTEIWGFDTEGIAQYNVGGQTGTTYIEQNLGLDSILGNGDTFTEIFTTKVTSGVDSIGNDNTAPYYWDAGAGTAAYSLKIDVSLSGYIFGYSNGGDGATTYVDYAKIVNDSYFTQMDAGTAKMYIDANGNDMFDSGETIAATFGFQYAAPSFIAPNVWPDGGGSANYSVAFSLDTYNDTDTFWTDGTFPGSLADLVANGFLLTYNDGSAHAVGIDGSPSNPDNTIQLGFSDNGIDVVFGAVPEPATMILFGIGLLGLAGVSRRKVL